MKTRRQIFLIAIGLALAGSLTAKTAAPRKAPESDLASKDVRHATVESAARLAKVEMPAPLPDDLPQPFNPEGFNRVAREVPRQTDAGPAVQAKLAAGDREILGAIAQRVTPTGTFNLGGARFLQFSKKRLKVGDHLTVTHEGQDYNLELTAIDATNFTLRLNREEITRPIKPGKNP
ncbi:MAG: hypothetical protein JWM35_1378 [Verrucomicrobia bacterium]|nr:hypothetical protein [Verrucomicrobiota bacterium]